jgi:hypothetical protein
VAIADCRLALQAVLDGGRHMLRIMDDLKATGSKDAEPSGIFRIGLSHALAQPSLVASIQRLTSRFTRLQPVLSTGLRQNSDDVAAIGHDHTSCESCDDCPSRRQHWTLHWKREWHSAHESASCASCS